MAQQISSPWTSAPGLVPSRSLSPFATMGGICVGICAGVCGRDQQAPAAPVPGPPLPVPADDQPPVPGPPLPAPGAAAGPTHRAQRGAFCEDPCPCCYYTRSTINAHGEYTPGWRLFGGYWSWWHKGAPHALVNWEVPGLGCNEPTVPRCECCYYNFMEGVPPRPWLVLWGVVDPVWVLDLAVERLWCSSCPWSKWRWRLVSGAG